MSKNNSGLRAITNLCAYIALVLIAVALIFSKFKFASNVSSIFTKIATYIAYALVGLSSFCYVMSRRGLLRKIIWAGCVATVVVLMII